MSSRRKAPPRLPVNTMTATTAFTSNLRQAAVLKSGSSSTVTPAPRNNSPSVAAASVSGSTSRCSARTRTQPSGWTSDEIHTAAGTTVDEGQNRPTRSTCSTPFCSAHHGVLVAQPLQPGAGLLVLGVLDGKEHHVNRTIYLGGIDVDEFRQHDRIVVVGPDLDRFARGVPAQHDGVTGGAQIRRDSRTDSAGSDECNAASHDRQATGGRAPSTLGSRLVKSFTGVFVLRTHAAGSLRTTDAGQKVTLAGWVARRRDHGGVIFIDLRDASGVSQVVFREGDVLAQAHRLRAEFCVAVTGVVEIRPEGNANPEIATGDIEVNATSLTVLGESAPLPFQLDEPAGEEARLKYRYLDLRREGPSYAIRLRSKANAAAREVLARNDFVEIETPTMTRSTPEGARDFLVPARLQPGSFYALPQSPQLFKQLLMVAGMERYYQIARCYRDEDFRADRQPEFTQLDMELSFVDTEDVMAVSEEVLKALWALIGYDVPTPLPRMTYADAMRLYGSDKPDLRFGLELVECADFFSDTPFRVFQAPYVGAVVMPGGASQPRRTLDAWQDFAKQRGHRG